MRGEPVRSKANTPIARTSSQRMTATMAPVSHNAKKVRSPNRASGLERGAAAGPSDGVAGSVNVARD